MKPLELRRVIDRFFPGETWAAWRAVAAALFALPPADRELEIFAQCTERATWPTEPARELWLVCGRRSGKSVFLSRIAVLLACFRDYDGILGPGELGIGALIAADRSQARVDLRYIAGLVDTQRALAHKVVRRTRERIELANRVTLEVHSASYRGIRGRTLIAAICDEIAFWRSEDSANPDVEILNAVRPAMATVPGALLLCASSPYAKRGALYQAFTKHFGRVDSPVLIWRAPSLVMNPTLDPQVVADAYAEDPAVAASEYGAEFRNDLESFLSREAIDGAVVAGRLELPAAPGVRYFGFSDPSGGSADSFTLAIAHEEQGCAVLDLVRERRPPFSPEAVVGEFAEVLRAYGVTEVRGDRYAGEWPREQFRKAGIAYAVSELAKSDIYRELLPALNSGRVELLDVPRLTAQLAGLERRVGRGGRDSIDHAPNARDDVANAAAGAIVATLEGTVAAAGAFLHPATAQPIEDVARVLERLRQRSGRLGGARRDRPSWRELLEVDGGA